MSFWRSSGRGLRNFIKGISIGSLRTYQVYEPLKVHAGLHKLNRERLRKAAPRLVGAVGRRESRSGARLGAGDFSSPICR